MTLRIYLSQGSRFLSLVLCIGFSPFILAFDIYNQDPNQADPLRNVTCIGELPPFAHNFPVAHFNNAPEPTLQNICAQTQYGGYPVPYNFQVFCERNRQGLWHVVAKPGETYFPGHLMYPQREKERFFRLLAYCTLRCTCTGVPASARANLRYEWAQADITIDLRHRDSNAPHGPATVADLLAYAQSRRRPCLRVTTSDDPALELPDDPLRKTKQLISIEHSNLVVCPAPLPRITLPNPATADMFLANDQGGLASPWPLTRLCAVALSYGNQKLNAGAYCHVSSTLPHRGEIWFADEMTPDPRWTFDASSEERVKVLTLRHYCAIHCRCTDPAIRTNPPMNNVFAWLLGDGSQMTRIDGSPQEEATYSLSQNRDSLEQCNLSCGSHSDCITRRQLGCETGGDVCVAQPKSYLGAVETNNRLSSWTSGLRGIYTYAICVSLASMARGRLQVRPSRSQSRLYDGLRRKRSIS